MFVVYSRSDILLLLLYIGTYLYIYYIHNLLYYNIIWNAIIRIKRVHGEYWLTLLRIERRTNDNYTKRLGKQNHRSPFVIGVRKKAVKLYHHTHCVQYHQSCGSHDYRNYDCVGSVSCRLNIILSKVDGDIIKHNNIIRVKWTREYAEMSGCFIVWGKCRKRTNQWFSK